MITAVSLFSGCGGFDLGARQSGVEVIWANDYNKYAADTYRNVFPAVDFYEGDIRSYNLADLPEADILIGCYPCQGYSAGALRGHNNQLAEKQFSNPDNFLYQKFAEAIEFVKPSFLFVENVDGLQSAMNGWFLKEQLRLFSIDNDYDVQAFIVRTHEYGLPQTRKRLFIVGVHRSLLYQYLLPSPTHGPKHSLPYQTLDDAIGMMVEWPEGRFDTNPFHGHYLTRNRKRKWSDCSYTIVAHSHHVPLHPAGEAMKKIGPDHWELQGVQNRRLSWDECVRIQGFPSDFEPSGPLSAKYMQIGNAVPPLISGMLIRPAVNYLATHKGSLKNTSG